MDPRAQICTSQALLVWKQSQKVLSLCGVCLRVLCALAIVGFGSWDLESPFLWQDIDFYDIAAPTWHAHICKPLFL